LAKLKVKDRMVHRSEYATVHEDSTLQEAIIALIEAQQAFDQTHYKHRAILITNKNDKVVGKLSQLDVIRALEPKYEVIEDPTYLSRFGMSKAYMNSLASKHKLWTGLLKDICKKSTKLVVKNFMHTPSEGEYVDENAYLSDGIHQIIMGRRQSLLVTRGKRIVGVLRLADVFKEVCDRIKDCPPEI